MCTDYVPLISHCAIVFELIYKNGSCRGSHITIFNKRISKNINNTTLSRSLQYIVFLLSSFPFQIWVIIPNMEYGFQLWDTTPVFMLIRFLALLYSLYFFLHMHLAMRTIYYLIMALLLYIAFEIGRAHV